jgi:Bacterial regulatory proteins, lacI family
MPLTRPLPATTISDVAKAAGVSTSTVSRAFSCSHMLKVETVNEVLVWPHGWDICPTLWPVP